MICDFSLRTTFECYVVKSGKKCGLQSIADYNRMRLTIVKVRYMGISQIWIHTLGLLLHCITSFWWEKLSQENTHGNWKCGELYYFLSTVAICIVSIYFDEKNFPTVVCHGVTYIEGVRRYRIWRSKNFHFIEIVFYWL